MNKRQTGKTTNKGETNMRTTPRSRLSLLFLTFVLLLAAPATALAQVAGPDGTGPSPAPTIQSDKEDYPPGGHVILTGSNWQPGEKVRINVDDDQTKTWEGNFDVEADENGDVRHEFDLPNWFVATYQVTATGEYSGEATTSFTDAAVQLQGQSKQACDPSKPQCDEGYQTVNLTGWQELDEIPMRLKFTGTGTYTVNVSFDHFKSSNKAPGVQDLYGWAAGNGVELTKAPVLTKSTGDVWAYTLEAKVATAGAVVSFKGNLAAGAHYFTGSSLAVSADNGAGTLQISKPSAAPGSPDLSVSKTGPTSAGRDETISYKLDYQNKSAATSSATGVQLTDVLPSGVTYVAGSCSGTCTVAGNEVTWNLGTLAPGANGSHTLKVRIPADAAFGAKYVNNARILSAEDDANLTDNTSSLETTVSFNRSPNAADDSLTTDEDTAGSVDVLANDTDPDGDALSVTGNTAPKNGSVTRSGGTFNYTPNADYNGPDSFAYTISDGKGGTATGTVNVTVNPANDAPKAADDSYAVDEDKTLTIEAPGILSNDSDVENDPLTAAKMAGPTNGTLELNADGSFTYTPKKDFNGKDSFTYKANDGSLDSNVATVGITVAPVNDAPVAKDLTGEDDRVTTPEDTPKGITLRATDVDSENLTFDVLDGPTNGALSGTGANLTYTPNKDYNGPDSFTFRVCDDSKPEPLCDEGRVDIDVTPVNDAPVARDDEYEVGEDGVLVAGEGKGVLSNDTDADNDKLTASIKSGPSNGTLTLNADGSFTYTPNAHFNGEDSFVYTVSDGNDATVDATVRVTVTAVNDAPVAEDGSVSTDEDTPKDTTLRASDVDGDSLGYSIVDGPSHGTLSGEGANRTYTPDANFDGEDSFTFKANDGSLDSNVATVSITVNPVNDAPVARDDTATTPEDTPIVILAADLLRNDSTGPANESGQKLTITRVFGAINGQAELDSEGNVVFTPVANYVGGAGFDYTVCDDGGTVNGGVACFEGTAKVRVTVSAVNDAPVAENDSSTIPEDTAKNMDVLANDADAENDNLTAVKVSDPARGTVTAGPDGTLTYTPDKDYNGTDSFTYKANDGDLDSNVARVSVTVTPVDDDPKASDDSYDVDEDETLAIPAPGVLSNDADADGDSLTAAPATETAHGRLTLDADGSLTYRPNADFDGEDSFTYRANDNRADSNVATVSITVNPANDAPVARDDRGSTGEAEAVGNSYISQYASPAAGTPTRLYRLDTSQRPYTLGKIGGDIVSPVNAIGYRSTDRSLYGYRLTGKLGIVKIDPSTGAARFLGNPRGLPASKSYIAGDVSPNGSTYYLYGNRSGVLRKVDLTTKPFRVSSVKLSKAINVADLAASPNDGKLYGVAKDGKLLKVDPRTGRVSARSVAGLKPGGYGATWFTAKGDLIAYENGASQAHGTMTWIAAPTTKAPSVVSSQAGPSTRGNDGAAYVAPPDPAGLSVVVDVLANDGDPDGTLDRNSLRIAQPPANGTASVNADKTITYTSGGSYRGADSFRYEVCDTGAPRQCAAATVDITSALITGQASPVAAREE